MQSFAMAPAGYSRLQDPTDPRRPELRIDNKWYVAESVKIIKIYLGCHHTLRLNEEEMSTNQQLDAIAESREALEPQTVTQLGVTVAGRRPLYKQKTNSGLEKEDMSVETKTTSQPRMHQYYLKRRMTTT